MPDFDFAGLLADLRTSSQAQLQEVLYEARERFDPDELSPSQLQDLIGAIEASGLTVPKGRSWRPRTRVRRFLLGLVPQVRDPIPGPLPPPPSSSSMLDIIEGAQHIPPLVPLEGAPQQRPLVFSALPGGIGQHLQLSPHVPSFRDNPCDGSVEFPPSAMTPLSFRPPCVASP
jgi:hypothetical protein